MCARPAWPTGSVSTGKSTHAIRRERRERRERNTKHTRHTDARERNVGRHDLLDAAGCACECQLAAPCRSENASTSLLACARLCGGRRLTSSFCDDDGGGGGEARASESRARLLNGTQTFEKHTDCSPVSPHWLSVCVFVCMYLVCVCVIVSCLICAIIC